VVNLLELLKINADLFARVSHLVGVTGGHIDSSDSMESAAQWIALLRKHLPLVEQECGRAGLPMTAIQIRKAMRAIDGNTIQSPTALAGAVEEIFSRLHDELSLQVFFNLPANKRDYFDSPTMGWEEVIERFPESIGDIEEMSRCFALSRYPAAVFHSVNAIEGVLVQLGKFLNVGDPKSGWTAVSGKLSLLVTKIKFPDLDPEFQAHYSFLEQLHGTVEALKSPWRNKISHTQGRLFLMTREFSPDVAEEIMVASRAFMRRLATEMPS
jgi:hypothetical protein